MDKKGKKEWIKAFLLGFASCLVLLGLYLFVFKGPLALNGNNFDFYKGLEAKYGKFYMMEELLAEEALFTYEEDEDFKDSIARNIIDNVRGDDYAQYYTKDEFSAFRSRFFSFIGTGIKVSDQDGHIVITQVISDSSAEKAGIKAGDIVVSVNGNKASSVSELRKMLEGDKGDSFKIELERDGKKIETEVKLTEISDDTVSYGVYKKDESVGIIKVISFAQGTVKDFEAAYEKLKEKGCNKLIIDLRNNPGGKESEGLDFADALLPACNIIIEKDGKDKETVHKSDADRIEMDYVILVNGNSASASEIVASAVKGNKSGSIVGEKTYGKGLIQRVYSFGDGSGFKYTCGEYFGPNGEKIQGKGVEPDVVADDKSVIEEAVRVLNASAKN